MAMENGGKQTMWRVGEEISARVESVHPKLEAKLGIRLSRTQVLDYLVNLGLESTGLEGVSQDQTSTTGKVE